MKKAITKLKRGSLKIISLLVVLLVVIPTEQAKSKKLYQFSLTTKSKPSKEPLQKAKAKVYKNQKIYKTSLIGKLSSTWSLRDAKMVVKIDYLAEQDQSAQFTKRLSISFPFKHSSDYINKSVTYSIQSENTAFRINTKDITQKLISRQNKQLDHAYSSNVDHFSLLNITIKIFGEAKTQEVGFESPQPQIKVLRFSFEDDHYIYHFDLFDIFIEAHDIKIDSALIICLLLILTSPCCSALILMEHHFYFYDIYSGLSIFLGFYPSTITYVLCSLSLFRFGNSSFSYIVLFLLLVMVNCVKCPPLFGFFDFWHTIHAIFKSHRPYAVASSLANLVWFFAILLEPSLILRTFFFSFSSVRR